MVIIGLDGADWEMIHELTGRGDLPHLAGMIEQGSSGVLHTVEPMLSPMLWTSIATGKAPPDHGVLDFFSVNELGERVPVQSRERQTKALWNIAGDHGLKVAFLGWQASHPAERVNGFMVTDRIAGIGLDGFSSPAGVTFPDDLLAELRPLVVPKSEISDQLLHRFFPGVEMGEIPFLEEMKMILAQTETIRRIALRLLDGDADLFGVYFQAIDEASHLLVRYMQPPLPGISDSERKRFGSGLESFYKYQDEVLGDLLSVIGPNTTIYVVSDHGFRLGEGRPFLEPSAKGTPYAPQWHRDNGIIVVRGPDVAAGRRLQRATIFDLAPTVLTQLGIPVGRDMTGSVLIDLWDSDSDRPQLSSIETHDRPGWREEVFAARSEDRDESRAAEELAKRLKALGYIGASEAGDVSRGSAAERANLAGYYMLQGEIGQALAEATAATEIDPEHYTAWRHLASIHRMTGRTDMAIDALSRAISLRPLAVEPWLMLVDLYRIDGRAEDALSSVRDLAEKAPDDFRVQNKLGELLMLAGQDYSALEAFKSSLRRHPGQEEGYTGLFSVLLNQGKYQEIKDLVGESSTTENIGARLRALGKAHFRRKEFSEAIAAFERSLERDPGRKDVHLHLGIAFGEQGRSEDSLREFKRALRIDADYAEAHFNKGITLLRSGAPRESIDPLRSASLLRPHSEPILSHLGKAHFMVGDSHRAREALQRALLINPSSQMARRYLALVDAETVPRAHDEEMK